MTTRPVVRSFPKRIDALPAIFAFLNEVLVPHAPDERARHDIAFAVEEFFTNMVKYTPESTNDITCSITPGETSIEVVLENPDVEPFDVTRAAETDTSLPLEERRPGGLGIQLSRALMDGIGYRYENRRSIITLTKKLTR